MNKENLLKKGNGSLAIAGIWGISAVMHPCPLCVLSSTLFFINSVREKLNK